MRRLRITKITIIKTVNIKDNQFVIIFPFFYDNSYWRKRRMMTFWFLSRLKNQDLILKELSILNEISLIRITLKQPFADGSSK